MKSFLISLMAFPVLIFSLNAQPGLGIDPIFNMSSVAANTYDTNLVVVANRDTANSFFGAVTVYYAFMDTTGGINVFNFDSSLGTIVINQNMGVPVQWIDSFPVPSAQYQYGGNTVVIWPVSPGAPTHDSLFHYFFIYNPNDVPERQDGVSLPLVYPNPVSDWIHIRSQNGGRPESLDVYTAEGKLIRKAHGSAVYLGDLPTGTYVIAIQSRGRTYKVKILCRN